MNDEIKEILDKCKRQIKNDLDYRMSPYQLKQLLDYITNLQQENENNHQGMLDECEKKLKIQQENERLKEKSINEVLKNDFDMCVKDLKKANKKIEKLEDYKSRCEKAVEIYDETITYLTTINAEYMDSNTKKTIQDIVNKLEKQLDVLNGRSDE